MDRVAQVFEKADIAHAQAQAPGAHQCGAQQGVPAQGPGAQGAEAGHAVGALVVGLDGGHALGTVGGIPVIAAAVPAIDAGSAPVQRVFGQGRGIPAVTVEGGIPCGDAAPGRAPGQTQRPGRRDLAGEARPEGRGVGQAALAAIEAIGGRGQADAVAPFAVAAVEPSVAVAERVLADRSQQRPGGEAYILGRHRQQKAEEVRIVQPAALAAIGGGPVVIEGPRPEGRQGQMFRERSGDADPGHVGIEDL